MKNRSSSKRVLLQNPYAFLNDKGTFDHDENNNLVALKASTPPLLNMTAAPKTLSAVSKDRQSKENPYAHLNSNGSIDHQIHLTSLVARKKAKYSEAEIIDIVSKLHRALWQNKGTNTSNPISLLDPSNVLEQLGYTVLDDKHDSMSTEIDDIAGYIDSNKNIVSISRSSRYSKGTQNFTLAHELGHATLHQAVGMHRDKGFDGSYKRSGSEYEADVFAKHFLMPANLVKSMFRDRFLTDKLSPNENIAFALNINFSELQRMSLRNLSIMLAKTSFFNGTPFKSLSDAFNVSPIAMAIRLEELQLVSL